MILVKLRLLGLAMGIVTLLTLTACGASSVDATDDGGGKGRTVTETARKSEPAPPADYVRSRCRECSCRVFSGKTGYCSRPACKHHWKEHRS